MKWFPSPVPEKIMFNLVGILLLCAAFLMAGICIGALATRRPRREWSDDTIAKRYYAVGFWHAVGTVSPSLWGDMRETIQFTAPEVVLKDFSFWMKILRSIQNTHGAPGQPPSLAQISNVIGGPRVAIGLDDTDDN